MSGYTVTPFGGSRRRKGKKVREAVMSEYTETETDCTTTKTEASDTDTSKLDVSNAVAGAIVTASTLVELRDQCGEDWLRSGAGDNTLHPGGGGGEGHGG